jgi:hypothetical protein
VDDLPETDTIVSFTQAVEVLVPTPNMSANPGAVHRLVVIEALPWAEERRTRLTRKAKRCARVGESGTDEQECKPCSDDSDLLHD